MHPARQGEERFKAERKARLSTSMGHSLATRRKGGPAAAAQARARAEALAELDSSDGGVQWLEDGGGRNKGQKGAEKKVRVSDRWDREDVDDLASESREEAGWPDAGDEPGKEGEEEQDEEVDEEDDSEEMGVGGETLPQRRLRPWERDSDMEEPLLSQADESDPMPNVRAVNFTFDVEEVTEQIKVEEAEKKRAEKARIEQEKSGTGSLWPI